MFLMVITSFSEQPCPLHTQGGSLRSSPIHLSKAGTAAPTTVKYMQLLWPFNLQYAYFQSEISDCTVWILKTIN